MINSTEQSDWLNETITLPIEKIENASSNSHPSGEDTVLALFLMLGGVLGIVGNSVVIMVTIFSGSVILKVTNVLIINQSVIDLIASLMLLIATTCRNILKLSVADMSPLIGDTYCRLISRNILVWGFFYCSTLNLMALAIERYLAVIHPVFHMNKVGIKKVYSLIGLIWFVGLGVNFAIGMTTTKAIDGICFISAIWPNPGTRMFVGVLSFFILFFVPLVIMIICYGSIGRFLRRKNTNTANRQHLKESKHHMRVKRDVFYTLILITLCFFVCYIFNQVFFLLFNLRVLPYSVLGGSFSQFSTVMISLNCCVNPFIYAAKYEEFQKGLKKFCCSKFSSVAPGADTTTTSTLEGTAEGPSSGRTAVQPSLEQAS